MKRIVNIIGTVLLACAVLTGCAGNNELIAKASTGTRQDVFQECNVTAATPGKAVLKVEFPVKNCKARLFNICFKHTDPSYTLFLNIDGQTTVLSNEPVFEDLPGYIDDNPEAGTGWKYDFKKTLMLQPGKHRVSIMVPISDVIVEKEIDLKEGENSFKLSPTYNASSGYSKFRKFSNGLRGIKMMLNNQEL